MALVGFTQIGPAVQQLGRGFDNAQRIADFVGQAHGHLAQGMQAVAATQLGFEMMQLAQSCGHMVEGAAQLGQFVVARHRHALVVVPGSDGAYPFGEVAQRPGKAFGNQPADGQRQYRADQEDQREQVALVDQPHQAAMAQQATVDHPLQLTGVVKDGPVQAAVAAGELFAGLTGFPQGLFDGAGHHQLAVFETLAGEYLGKACRIGQVQTQVEGVHVGHAGQKAAVHIGSHQQLIVHSILAGGKGRDYGAGWHTADIDSLQYSVGAQADLVDNGVAGGTENHFVVAVTDQRDHVYAHGFGDVGSQPVMADGLAGGRRVGVLQKQLGGAGVVREDFADLVLDDFGRLLQPDPYVTVENLRQGGRCQFGSNHGRDHADQPERQHQFALYGPARHFEGLWLARCFGRGGH